MKDRYKKNRDDISRTRAVKMAIMFANEDERKRYIKFHEELKDLWSHCCVSCHRMSVSGLRPIVGGLRGLKEKLGKDLFQETITTPLRPGLVIDNKIYLCSHCRKHLFQMKKMPPYCVKNGLECEYVPPPLDDLNDLEKILGSKRILFLKIFHLPKSRWKAVKDKTVNIPILDDDLLKTLNSVKAFPRKPDEAGLIPIKLKRKLEYKNKHLEAYVRPDVLVQSVQKYQELGHPAYQNIDIRQIGTQPVDSEEEELHFDDSSSSSTDEEDEHHPIAGHQYNMGSASVMTDKFPESSVVINQSDKVIEAKRGHDSKQGLSLAPGEGKVPTNLMRDEFWDTEGFPYLHPSGRFGLHYKRKHKITAQDYFKQRLMNIDKKWSNDKTYLFSALYYVERMQLERQINVSYRRGKVVGGQLVNMEDVCSVFDKVTGTWRYWKQKRYEVLAKLEQLGAFQFFFTLSCADRRWDETFVAILRQKGLKISYKPSDDKVRSKYSYQPEQVWVTTEDGTEQLLRDYLAHEREHELIKENVLTLTMAFDKRVHAFMNRIVKAKSSPMKVQFYHYRVEFQLRGAGHVHGVLWLDLKELEPSFPGIQSIMTKLRVSAKLDERDKDVMQNFIDTFVTCSLDEEGVADIARSVQKHRHSNTCYKRGRTCRFHFPRFPSERTIVAQPLDQNDFASQEEYTEEKKRLQDILLKVKEVLESLSEEELETTTIQEVLTKANVTHCSYYEALETSLTGATVILKRKVCEVNINNFNSEWLKAWDGNMDLSVCLDFFAITTYITDYYTKSETAMAFEMKEALKKCSGMGMKDQMKFIAQTFLNHRQMGESEALYRMIPQLHLSESNLKCEYVATGFPWNRSKFSYKAADKDRVLEDHEDGDEDDPESEPRRNFFEIPGREGTFMSPVSVHEKYACRPEQLEEICLAQFIICYDMMAASKRKEEEEEDFLTQNNDMKIVSWNPAFEMPMLNVIKLDKKMGFMKLRGTPKVLRQHKFREENNPHEFFFSQLLLYRPWRKEEELFPSDIEECIQLYQEVDAEEAHKSQHLRKSKVEKVQEKLFPLKNDVEEARAILEDLPDNRTQHIGDVLDAENEHDNEEQAAEGIKEAEEHAARHPGNRFQDVSFSKYEETTYRRIDISNENKMLTMARQLDEDQRFAFDIVIKYVKQLRTSRNSNQPMPKPPLLKVHGGAGCGKSMFINTLAPYVEYFMSIYSDKDPDKPAVLKLAPTGKAASGIKGMTYFAGLNIPWGNQSFSMSNETRDTKRSQLCNLTLIIIDEMSMLKSDALYQIDLRLKEITESQSDFGGVGVVLCGDLMQLRPIKAYWIFDEPFCEDYHVSDALHPLWKQFDAIELRHNHRQGKDKDYGDLLNRVRRGRQTKEDCDKLEARVTNIFPEEGFHVYGKNAPAHKVNQEKLSELDTQLEVLKALHIHPNPNGPRIDEYGFVWETPFMDKLRVKVGARVMLTYNIDTSDGLVNGATGIIVGFVKENGRVVKILIEFDEEEDGEKLRKKYQAQLAKLKMPNATPIGRSSFEYSVGRSKKQHGAKAKVIQFPVTLAWAVTAHKCQGMTVKNPMPLIADMNSVFTKAQAYVMLGRIQNIDQLHLKSFSPGKIMVDERAADEADKIEREALNNPNNRLEDDWTSTNSYIRKVASLNIR